MQHDSMGGATPLRLMGWLLACTWLAVACGGGGSPAPASAEFVPLAQDTSLPGEERAVRLAVAGPQGERLEGVRVEFSTAAGHGSVAPESAFTTADGVATSRWTLGSSDVARQFVTARVAGLAPVQMGVDVAALGLAVQDLRAAASQNIRCTTDMKSVPVDALACTRPISELKLQVSGSAANSAFGHASGTLRCANVRIALRPLLRGTQVTVTLRWQQGQAASVQVDGQPAGTAEVELVPFVAGGSLELSAGGCGVDNFHFGDIRIADFAFWAD
ncbi:MAG: hypothetical protein JNJ89_02360 [Rubrivivax sp.]|nr:hypothetical protein [Rubrivivax sp.]